MVISASMDFSVSGDSAVFLLYSMTGIPNEYQYASFTGSSYCSSYLFYLSLFKCLSSIPLLPLMHKIARCSVNNFPVQISFWFYLLYFLFPKKCKILHTDADISL